MLKIQKTNNYNGQIQTEDERIIMTLDATVDATEVPHKLTYMNQYINDYMLYSSNIDLVLQEQAKFQKQILEEVSAK